MQAHEVKDIRSQIEKSNARGVKALVAEERFWRGSWPLILFAAVALNIIFAAGYMAHVAPPDDAPPVIFGMNWSALQNWIAAAVLIVGTRIVSVFVEDVRDQDDDEAGIRFKLKTLKAALVFFSIFTAAMGVSLGIQSKMDAGISDSAAYTAATNATATERQGLSAALQTLESARMDWAKYKADVQASPKQADRDWMMRPSATGPYLAAIARAEQAENSARARLSDAQTRQGEAVTTGGSEAVQLGEVGAWAAGIARAVGIPVTGDFDASAVALGFGVFVAVLLEWLCVGGQSGAAAAKRSIMRDAARALDDAKADVTASIQTHPAPSGHVQMYPDTTGRGADASGSVLSMADHVKHSEGVAEALADARSGRLETAAIGVLKKRYGGEKAAMIIRDKLVAEGLAVPGAAGQLVLTGAAMA